MGPKLSAAAAAMEYHPVPLTEGDDDRAGVGNVLETGDEGEEDDIEMTEMLGDGQPSGMPVDAEEYGGWGRRRKPKVIYLLIFFLMNSLAFGITVVPRINIFTGLVCREVLPLTWKPSPDNSPAAAASSPGNSTMAAATAASGPPPVVVGGFNPQCATDAVSSTTAWVASIGGAIGGTLSMISGTWLSVLSDRIGRVKVVMYCAVVMLAAEAMLIALARAAANGESLAPFGYRWLWLIWVVDGLSGTFSTVMSMASAYISDTEPEDRRNVQQGRVHGVLFIGIAVGPALSSLILKASGQESPLLVFYICIVARSLSCIYLWFFVPESLPRKRQEDFNLRTLFPWQQGTKGFGLVEKIGKLNPTRWLDRLAPPVLIGSAPLRRNIKILVAINVVCYAGAVSAGEVLILYPQMVFKWGNLENNYFMSVINAFRAAVSWLGIPMLIFLFRKPRQLLPHHMAKPSPPTTAATPSSSSSTPTLTPPSGGNETPTSATSQSPHPALASPAPLDDGLTAAGEPGPIPPQNLYNPCPGPDALDRHLILTALLFDIFGFSGYALSPNGVLFTLCGALAAFGAIGLSTTEAALTKHVATHRVGLLMGGLGVLQAIVRIIAPAAVNAVYSWSVAWWPGLAFLVVAAMLGIGVALTAGAMRVLDKREG